MNKDLGLFGYTPGAFWRKEEKHSSDATDAFLLRLNKIFQQR